MRKHNSAIASKVKVVVDVLTSGELEITDKDADILEICAPNATIKRLPPNITHMYVRNSNIDCEIPKTVKYLYLRSSSIMGQTIEQDMETVFIMDPYTPTSSLKFAGKVTSVMLEGGRGLWGQPVSRYWSNHWTLDTHRFF